LLLFFKKEDLPCLPRGYSRYKTESLLKPHIWRASPSWNPTARVTRCPTRAQNTIRREGDTVHAINIRHPPIRHAAGVNFRVARGARRQ
jgi:hypothetical protein